MLKMTIDNEEVVSDKDITINEEMLSASSTILNNVYPKEWEEDKDYTSRFYYPQDYSKAMIQRSYVTQEAEAGTTIQVNGSATLTDVDTTKNSRVLRLLGQTSQTGTPTPSLPIPVNVVSGDNEIVVCGMNICFTDFGDWESGEYNSSGGKANNTSRVRTKDLLIVRQSTTYYFDTFSGNDLFIVREYDKNKTFIKNDGIKVNGGTITTMSNCYFLGITLFSNTNQTRSYDIYQTLFEESTIRPFICLNSVSDKTYEPYIGNTYNIDLPVENLAQYDNELYTSNALNNLGAFNITLDNSVDINTTDTYYFSADIRLKSGTGDYMNTIRSGTNTGQTAVNVVNPTLSSSFQRYIVKCTYSQAQTCTIISFQIKQSSSAVLEVKNLMISKSNNSYTPYGTTPIELCKIGSYQDYIYKEDDKWYLHKEIGKVVLNGSESWNYSPGNVVFYSDVIKPFAIPSNFLCNYYEKIDNSITFGNMTNGTAKYENNVNGRLIIKDTRYTNVNDYKNWLSTHNVTLYYVLSTSTNTEITYQPLIEQLNALSSQ